MTGSTVSWGSMRLGWLTTCTSKMSQASALRTVARFLGLFGKAFNTRDLALFSDALFPYLYFVSVTSPARYFFTAVMVLALNVHLVVFPSSVFPFSF